MDQFDGVIPTTLAFKTNHTAAFKSHKVSFMVYTWLLVRLSENVKPLSQIFKKNKKKKVKRRRRLWYVFTQFPVQSEEMRIAHLCL